MHYQNSRLAYARDILMGAEQRLGVATVRSVELASPQVLREGTVYCADGSIGQMVSALCAALTEDGWCAAVGLPEIGWGAAADRGLPLDRVVVIPDTRGKVEAVLHYLIPYVDVVAVGDGRLTRGQQQKVAARLRRYRTSLVTLQPWPGISRSLPGRVARAGTSGHMDEATVGSLVG